VRLEGLDELKTLREYGLVQLRQLLRPVVASAAHIIHYMNFFRACVLQSVNMATAAQFTACKKICNIEVRQILGLYRPSLHRFKGQ
jgi:hypothetical protein